MLTIGVFVCIAAACAISFCLGYLVRQIGEQPRDNIAHGDCTTPPTVNQPRGD